MSISRSRGGHNSVWVSAGASFQRDHEFEMVSRRDTKMVHNVCTVCMYVYTMFVCIYYVCMYVCMYAVVCSGNICTDIYLQRLYVMYVCVYVYTVCTVCTVCSGIDVCMYVCGRDVCTVCTYVCMWYRCM